MYKESDIVHETVNFWVSREPKGFKVWQIGFTHSTLVSTIGYDGPRGLDRAIAECNRREMGLIANPA